MAMTQDQSDNEEIPPGDDQSEEGRATAGAEGNDNVIECNEKSIQIDLNNVCFIYTFIISIQLLFFSESERDDEQRQTQKKSRRKALLLDNDTREQLI